MSVANTKATGNGSLRFRLEIEGWPCEWVSDLSITHANGKDGRLVFEGLMYEPLRIRDRIVMQLSELQCDGIKFQIVPPYKLYNATVPTDEDTYYLSREVDVSERLGANLAHDATVLVTYSGNDFSSGDVIHIGTEAIRMGITNAIAERAIWGTQPQSHAVSFAGEERAYVYIYRDIPPTMEGRRAVLYAYGDSDDVAGDGTVMWRGMVAAVPRTSDDALTWIIDCEPVTQVLNQDVAAALLEAHPIGIYHHKNAPFACKCRFGGETYGPIWYTWHDINEAEMLANISAVLVSLIGTAGATGYISSVALVKLTDGQLAVRVERTSATPEEFVLVCGSIVLGFANSVIDDWRFGEVSASTVLSFLTFGGPNLLPSTTYFLMLQQVHPEAVDYDHGFRYGGAPASPLGQANWLMKHADRQSMWVNPNTLAQPYSPYRIYVDADLTGATSVYIPGTNKGDGIFNVETVGVETVGGVDKRYIQLFPATGVTPVALGAAASSSHGNLFLGFLGNETTITVLRQYAVGALPQFIAGLKEKARDHANEGDTPFVTGADLSDFTPATPIQGVAAARVYTFAKSMRLVDILKEECKFIGHCMRIEADGTIGIVPLPRWTDATPVDALHTIDLDDIIEPPDAESWPSYAPNKDGRSTVVSVQHYYDWRSNQHIDKAAVFEAREVIPVTKGRGKSTLTIKPVSSPLFYEEGPGNTAMLKAIAKNVLDYFSGNRAIVSFEVPYTKLDVLCGDIVSITHPLILGGDGYKGVTGRRGVVIERGWNFDPQQNARGKLTVMLTGRNVVGWAPSAFLTNATFVSGTTWILEASSTDGFNHTAASYFDPAQVLAHFAVGDRIHIQRMDQYTEDNIRGTITAIDLSVPGFETATVEFYMPFTTGADVGEDIDPGHIMEFAPDYGVSVPGYPEPTASQRRYAYVAESFTEVLPDGTFARRLS